MPPPLLLVDDDLATIAQVKRLLAREGYEVVLATNAADAVIAWGSHLPPLVLLNPKVESDRGKVVLDELRSHPDAALLHVLLLGESVPGFGYPVAALPIDETFASTVHELVRGTTSAEGWQVHVSPRTRTEELPAIPMPAPAQESESWRATRKSPVPGRSDDEENQSVTAETPAPSEESAEPPTELFSTGAEPDAAQAGEVAAYTTRAEELPPNEAEQAGEVAAYTSHDDSAAVPPPQVSPPTQELENSLFGDLEANMANEVEAQAMASVAASLAQMPVDDELQALEDDVRAEAARRRQQRQAPSAPSAGLPTPDRSPEPRAASGAEDSFSGFDEPAPTPPPDDAPAAPAESDDAVAQRLEEESARARQTLARAEQVAHRAAAALAERGQQEGEQTQALHAELAAARHALEQAEAQSRDVYAQLEEARSAIAEAQLKGREEQAERERLQAELSEGQRRFEGEGQQLWSEVERLENELGEVRRELEVATAQLEESKQQLHQRSEAAAMLELELDDTRTRLDQSASNARALEEALAQTQAAAQETQAQLKARASEIEGARAEASEFQVRLERIHEARLALERERDSIKEQLAGNLAQSQELTTAASRAAGALREAMEEAEQAESRAESAQAQTQAAQAEAEALRERAERAEDEGQVATRRATDAEERARAAEEASSAAEAGLRTLQAEVETLKADFTGAHEKQRNLEEALEDARAANAEVRARAEENETKVRVLEEKSQLPLRVPNRAPLSVPRFGNLELGELARLIGQLVLARAEVRLELAAPGGRRTVWLARGAVVAAESSFGNESLLDRTRRDGLIDARQTAELQMIRNATPAQTVVVLKERGLVREAEVVPLVQRYTEQVALDAFSEPKSEYRLTEESPGPETLAATLPRPTLPLVAEALRRALPVEELLLRLGGSEAVPVTLESELDLRALGFADKERRMLGYCDGEANVEDLALASGLKADVAFRAMLVARLLGLIDLKIPARTSVTPSAEVDVERLEAKFEQVQDADYFTMLGLGRAAGGDEVLRAWQRLSEEFDPIKYSGHPDTVIQQRAQLVYAVLEEAARALGDDRRRAEYARHLVD